MASKSKSSKAATKGSKEGGKSKGKASDEEKVPPVERAVQTCPNNFCYLCCFQVAETAGLQSHVLLLSHAPQKFGDVVPDHVCRLCKQKVPLKWGPDHKCCGLKTSFIQRNTSGPTLQGGAPFRCLLCRGRPFKSRSDLTVHLLVVHKPGRPLGKCGLCDFRFQEDPPPDYTKGLTPPPENDLEARKQYQKALWEAELAELLKSENGELGSGQKDLLKHCVSSHNPLHRLIARKAVYEQSELRMPYSCCLCGRTFRTNWDFQAHVIYRHAMPVDFGGKFYSCTACGETVTSDEALDFHIRLQHAPKLQCYANFLEAKELLQEYVCCATTCSVCWECFDTDFALQAHLLTSHTADTKFLHCGWCKMDYTKGLTPVEALQVFLNHEHNHTRELHAIALETYMTRQPLPEPLPDGMTQEAVMAALKAQGGQVGGEEEEAKAGKGKGSKEKSNSKRSSKSKDKSKSKSKK